MTPVVAVIPARLGSTRFPRKILHRFQGKPLIEYVWSSVTRAKQVDRVLIATDSGEIRRAAESFGAEVAMTSKRHRTGSDRVAEAVAGIKAKLVINVQGDCFGLRPAVLDRVVKALSTDRKIKFATLAHPIETDRELDDPGLVKLTVDARNRALWFSRSPLPYLQGAKRGARTGQFRYLGHMGVYFFRPETLRAFADWKRTRHEKAESLEQLRILENDGKMQVFITRTKSISIDTPADLKKIGSI